MATATTPAAPTSRRIDIDDHHAIELTAGITRGATLHVTEGEHDAAVLLGPDQLAELRAELSLLIGDAVLPAQVISDHGRAIAEGVRKMFVALVEHEKSNPGEVLALYAAIVAHVRSAKPFVLREVGQ